ncbi:MAG: thiamine-phosphate kinase [Proteobacteria bacterium]|nr:thiamine-phosphate kinase [Pseudomonadota bacterium]
MLSEHDIIQKLQEIVDSPPCGVKGIGDDAAVIPLSETTSYVISKDLLIEDTHFRLHYGDPESLSHKVLHVNLSDIAAMGAEPQFALLGLSIPPYLNQTWVDRFLEGFVRESKKQSILLIGGDTTASPQGLFISVTLIGKAQNSHLKFRNGANPGDILCVAGSLGEAGAGLRALEKDIIGLESLKKKTLRPEALIHEGIWFGQRPDVTAMMDISDGLYIDLSRLCQASCVGATVDLNALHPSTILQEACQMMKLDSLEYMLIGGEDYALLVTISPDVHQSTSRDFTQAFGYPLIPIGKITKEREVILTQQGIPQPFAYTPFSHFREL